MKYDTDIKPQIMRSMEMSWTPRPTYRTNAIDTTPKNARKDRRTHKIRRFYYNCKDDFGLVVMSLAVFGGGVLLWLALAEVEKWMR